MIWYDQNSGRDISGTQTNSTDVYFEGNADPEVYIRVVANGDEIGETYSDDTGKWTLFPEYELEPGDYELWAYAYDPNTPPGYQEDAYYSEDSREVFVPVSYTHLTLPTKA